MKPIKHKGCTMGCHGSCCLRVEDLSVTMGNRSDFGTCQLPHALR